ncbi:MAG TPA: peptide-binding protein [Polyangiales bacterium]|nr:peptide-binding protein [Polyangiales bacterium]
MARARVRSTRWLLLACLASACTHGKKPAPPREQAPAIAPAAVDSDWQAGRLPAAETEGTPVAGGELVVRLDADPPSLNTLIDPDRIASWVIRHRVYEGLVRSDPYDDPNYRIQPELAESWEISPDGRRYTFHLRKGVKFHDGEPFSARDVIATFDKIRDQTTKAASTRSYFEELQSIAAPDEFTVVFVWKRPYFLTLDSIADVIIQPAHVIAKLSGAQYNDAATNPLNRHPIGTGPFRFASWDSHEKIVIARNDGYYGDKPYLDRVVFRIVPDATVAQQLAERGELDLLYKIPTEAWMRLDPALQAHWYRSRFFSSNYGWIGWNELRPYFSDKNVRRALTMLVDRPGIIDKLLHGLYKPTTCHFYWASKACDPALKPLPFDPEAAAKLLDEAGWIDHDHDGVRDKNGQPFHFVFMLPSASTEAARWAAKIKEDLSHVGIEMDLQRVEWAAFLKRLRDHDFDAATLAWSSDARGDPTQIWHSSSIQDGSNYISYRNPAVDKLIEDARAILDEDARDALYRKFGAILHDEQPYTFMYVRSELDMINKRVKGARATLYWWQFERMWIDPSVKGR